MRVYRFYSALIPYFCRSESDLTNYNEMKYTTISLIAAGALLSLSSCKNPADSTTSAEVSEAKEASTSQGGVRYDFSESSTIGFIGSKVTGSQSGEFKTFAGHFTVKDGEPQSGEFTIDMNSTSTEKEKLTEHLKASDFFDVANYPESKFVVTNFSKKSDTSYDLSGNFTLKGVTKNITFPTTVSEKDNSVTIESDFSINRQDFGISYEGKKDDLIRDEVVLKLNLKAVAK